MHKNKLLKIKEFSVCVFLLYSIAVNADNSGETLYIQNCMVCHADDGSGAMPGVFDLEKNRAWSKITESKLLIRLNEGIQSSVSGVSMPPKGGNANLSDKDLKKIIRYMRESFLN